jgi:16S rRNA (cytidine1402-2'-O)-methyltransferase
MKKHGRAADGKGGRTVGDQRDGSVAAPVDAPTDAGTSAGESAGTSAGASVGMGRLYVVATPIGNLDDITLRALKVLAEADIVAAEDTRNTAGLLARHGIRRRMLSLHEHNEAARATEIIALLAGGQQVALVSDAGTPVLSDPGALLVARVREAGHPVVPIPGPSAAIAALSVAGLAGRAFHFAGFLPERSSARKSAIAGLAKLESILVFYEAPHRVQDTVADLAAVLAPSEGDAAPSDTVRRDIVIARELTKLFESVHRCPLADAAAWMAADPNRVRGEFVLLVTGSAPRKSQGTAELALDQVLAPLLAELPLAQSVKLACRITGLRRGEVYARALELAGKAPRTGD